MFCKNCQFFSSSENAPTLFQSESLKLELFSDIKVWSNLLSTYYLLCLEVTNFIHENSLSFIRYVSLSSLFESAKITAKLVKCTRPEIILRTKFLLLLDASNSIPISKFLWISLFFIVRSFSYILLYSLLSHPNYRRCCFKMGAPPWRAGGFVLLPLLLLFACLSAMRLDPERIATRLRIEVGFIGLCRTYLLSSLILLL